MGVEISVKQSGDYKIKPGQWVLKLVSSSPLIMKLGQVNHQTAVIIRLLDTYISTH